MIVVIPTNRSVSFEYLKPLIDSGARFIVVDDSDGSVSVNHPQFQVYNWKDQDRMLGANKIAIPRRNGACRDFGFYLAWKNSDPGEIIVALDDDEIVEEGFVREMQAALGDGPKRIARGDGTQFNILDCYRNIEPNLFPRGFPYSRRVDYRPWVFESEQKGDVMFNLGLWRGVFDVNAIDKLQGLRYNYPDAELHHPSVVVPNGALISVCAGNMHFRRELIPAVYQFVMHVEVLPGWVIDRYGDIWGGFILKTLMDLKGDRMSVGAPMILHKKEGKHERNIWQEHLAHLVNDEFIALLAAAKEDVTPSSYLSMVEQLTESIERGSANQSALLGCYLRSQIPALMAWTKILT